MCKDYKYPMSKIYGTFQFSGRNNLTFIIFQKNKITKQILINFYKKIYDNFTIFDTKYQNHLKLKKLLRLLT